MEILYNNMMVIMTKFRFTKPQPGLDQPRSYGMKGGKIPDHQKGSVRVRT